MSIALRLGSAVKWLRACDWQGIGTIVLLVVLFLIMGSIFAGAPLTEIFR